MRTSIIQCSRLRGNCKERSTASFSAWKILFKSPNLLPAFSINFNLLRSVIYQFQVSLHLWKFSSSVLFIFFIYWAIQKICEQCDKIIVLKFRSEVVSSQFHLRGGDGGGGKWGGRKKKDFCLIISIFQAIPFVERRTDRRRGERELFCNGFRWREGGEERRKNSVLQF